LGKLFFPPRVGLLGELDLWDSPIDWIRLEIMAISRFITLFAKLCYIVSLNILGEVGDIELLLEDTIVPFVLIPSVLFPGVLIPGDAADI